MLSRSFTHQCPFFYPPMPVLLPTLASVLLPTRISLKAFRDKALEIHHTRARVFYSFNKFNAKYRGGLCHPPHPLQEEIESSPKSVWIPFFVAVTTKQIKPQGFFLNRFLPTSWAPPIYRTAQARHALDL
jgi:hypothetical protein